MFLRYKNNATVKFEPILLITYPVVVKTCCKMNKIEQLHMAQNMAKIMAGKY